MVDPLLVELSRLQFALTALYHFLFVPLTLGLSILIAMMETVYVMTGRTIWRDMTKFWGVLFGINFALGVATGITMEFQFGMNWAYYSHYVGDVFGAPLAIEGLMAFFLEATFVGLFFFGWDRLSPRAHLIVTWLMALGTNFSALWILIANGWMQNPVGAAFNIDTMRMEVTDFTAVIFNPVAQAKFVHTVSAGYVCAATFVLGVSGWYMLRGRHIQLAKRIRLIRSDDVVGVDGSEVSRLRSISTPPGRLLHEINEEALKHGSGATTNIYFARAGNAIKVGQSSDVPSRIAALQTASPQEIRVIGVIRGRDGLEARIGGG